MNSRSYLVGLPVLITVNDDGTIEYDIDTSEAGAELRDYDGMTDDDLATLLADAALVDQAHEAKRRAAIEENYRLLVRRIGPGFHPDTPADGYVSLPEGVDADMIEARLAAAHAVDLDVYAVALDEQLRQS